MQVFGEAFNVVNKRIITGVNSTYSGYSAPSSSCSGTAPSGSTFAGCYTPYSVGTASAFDVPNGTNNLLVGPRQLQVSAKLFF